MQNNGSLDPPSPPLVVGPPPPPRRGRARRGWGQREGLWRGADTAAPLAGSNVRPTQPINSQKWPKNGKNERKRPNISPPKTTKSTPPKKITGLAGAFPKTPAPTPLSHPLPFLVEHSTEVDTSTFSRQRGSLRRLSKNWNRWVLVEDPNTLFCGNVPTRKTRVYPFHVFFLR